MSQHAPKRPSCFFFFPFWGGCVVLDILKFCCSQCVPNTFLKFPKFPKFIMRSQHVHNSYSFCPICFAQLYHLGMTQCGWVNIEIYIFFMFGMNTSILGSLQSFKLFFFVKWANQRSPSPKKRKKKVKFGLITTNLYKSHYFIFKSFTNLKSLQFMKSLFYQDWIFSCSLVKCEFFKKFHSVK